MKLSLHTPCYLSGSSPLVIALWLCCMPKHFVTLIPLFLQFSVCFGLVHILCFRKSVLVKLSMTHFSEAFLYSWCNHSLYDLAFWKLWLLFYSMCLLSKSQPIFPREFHMCMCDCLSTECVCWRHFTLSKFRTVKLGDHVFRVVHSALHVIHVLLYQAINEVFFAANQKLFINKELCTRKSVKQTLKGVRTNALLQLGNLQCHAVLVRSQKSARTPTQLPGC